jgi:trimeric autotransporter adhesin
MTGKNFVSRVLLAAVFFGMLTPPHAFGGSAAIGAIAGSRDATVGGEAVQPNTVVFSGDTLRVADGAAVVAMNTGSRVVLGQRTAASFLKGSDEVVVVLEQGNVSMYHPGSAEPLRLRLGGLSVGPAKGFNTLGDVAMLNGMAVVTAKEGMLRLERNGSAIEVSKGRTISVPVKVTRAPQGAPSAAAGPPPQRAGGSSSLLPWIGVAAGATGAILGGVGISNGNNASNKANNALAASSAAASTATGAATAAQTATTTAQAATSAAVAATSAAVAATSVAIDAGAAAQAAGSAAVEAALIGEAAANIVGCDLNRFANSQDEPSPYTPFTGFTCH